MSKNKIKVILVKPWTQPYVDEISSDLISLQKQVGGLIQAIYPFNDPVAVICNEEGKLLGLPFNRPLYNNENTIYDIIVGTFIIVGLKNEQFSSLPDNYIEKYLEYFSVNNLL